MSNAPPQAQPWLSAITDIQPGHIVVRGYDLAQLLGNISFAETIFLLWTGKMAPAEWAPLLNALFIAAIDHGPGAPSALTARTVISGGGELNAAGAAGLLTMGQFHGAAVTDAMELLYDIATRQMASVEPALALSESLEAWRATHRRFPGLGHRFHATDPRVELIWSLARQGHLPERFLQIEMAIATKASELVGKPLPINIDGVIASVLCAMDIPAPMGNLFFYIARLCGVLAHAYEEQQNMPPMRRIHPTAFEYNGPTLDTNTSQG